MARHGLADHGARGQLAHRPVGCRCQRRCPTFLRIGGRYGTHQNGDGRRGNKGSGIGTVLRTEDGDLWLRLTQIPRSCAPAHARRSLEHIVNPEPQQPHFVRPLKRYVGRRMRTRLVPSAIALRVSPWRFLTDSQRLSSTMRDGNACSAPLAMRPQGLWPAYTGAVERSASCQTVSGTRHFGARRGGRTSTRRLIRRYAVGEATRAACLGKPSETRMSVGE